MALDPHKSKNLWQGRTWLPIPGDRKLKPADKAVRFMSYNVFADSKSLFVNHSTNTHWDIRSKALLEEIKSYEPDIMCLQDVDHFKEFWRPRLMMMGYESIYLPRTQLKDYHSEGVVIAFKSNLFQLFKTVHIEFNVAIDENYKGIAFEDRCKTDDVGLIIFLQPWTRDYIKSALCVACAMLNDHEKNGDVRAAHCQYFTNQIEIANKEFHVPVLMGMTLNDTPSSLSYNLLMTGRQPLIAQVPNKCNTPYGTATCRGSILLKWLPPPSSLADLPIISYTIAWRPGGSRTLGFRSQVNIGIGDCVKYGEKTDEKGHKRVVALDEKQFIITGLVSDVPYEFKVTALNDMGEGLWSDISEPIILKNPEKAPNMPELVNFATLMELNETRESTLMNKLDWDVHFAYKADPMSSLTQLTPRDRDGNILAAPRTSILPVNANPRTGWKEALHGTQDPRMIFEMNRESVISSSILRNHDGYINTDLNEYYDGVMTNGNTGLLCLTSNYVADDKNNTTKLLTNGATPTTVTVSKGGGAVTMYTNQEFDVHVNNKASIIQTVPEKTAVILDCKEAMSHIGAPNARQVHDLLLASAYDSYSTGGEPIFTQSIPKEKNRFGVECVDYILYTKTNLVPIRILSMPLLSQLQQDGENPQETMTRIDHLLLKPFPCASDIFDERLNKLHSDLNEGRLETSDDVNKQQQQQNTSPGKGKKPKSQVTAHPPPNQYKVAEYKRKLKDILNKSRVAGNNLAPPVTNASVTSATNAAVVSSATSYSRSSGGVDGEAKLWGGQWVPFPQDNHQRANCWLPNQSYHSAHIAICCDFIIDDNFLSTQWT